MAADAPNRVAAGIERLLSCYERAPLRMVLASEAVGPLDIALVALVRFLLPKRARDVRQLDGSGWRGNLLFLGVWTIVIAGIAAPFAQ